MPTTGAVELVAAPFNVLFTDLDGTLLDESTYGFEPARPAIRALQEQKIPIIFCTSKTFAETVLLQEALKISDPFIVENGGAIYFRQGQLDPSGIEVQPQGAWRRIGLGVPYRALVAQLVAIRELTGIKLRGFSDMSAAEIAADCGLPVEAAEIAQRREFDEPFRLMDDAPEDLARIANLVRGVGLDLTSGGRFHHLSGRSDKGRAIRLLCERLSVIQAPLRSAGLGDSPNDLPMLQAVDLPIIVQRPGGAYHPVLLGNLPKALRAPGVGPEGWNVAVNGLLEADHAV